MVIEYKTNVMRILDSHKIPYKQYSYDASCSPSGVEIAEVLNQNPLQVFKTLVTVSKTNKNYVFMIPVGKELDLKKAAICVHEKSIDMLKQKDLLGLTGYVHGGCSPIGMKKQFKTVIDSSVNNFDTVIFSAGKVGYQVEIKVVDLMKVIPIVSANIVYE